jgi:hypothetical protein
MAHTATVNGRRLIWEVNIKIIVKYVGLEMLHWFALPYSADKELVLINGAVNIRDL